MNSRNLAICVTAAMASAPVPIAALAACTVHSGPNTAALVELYTSEGCSSCPPADRQLSQLRASVDPAAEVVALALHVGDWDYIGWKDPYAQTAFSDRQSWLVRVNKRRVVYTPQFFVGGRDSQPSADALRDAVRHINAVPATATIRLQAGLTPSGALALSTDATVRDEKNPTALYLTVAESGLLSRVTRGENRGITLTHDHVAREWIGPIQLKDGAARAQREIVLPPTWNRARLEVAAFVQDERDGRVLQAVRAPNCAGS